MARLRPVAERERKWAQRLLVWQPRELWEEAETAHVKYFVAAGPYEVQAWAEVRDWDGRRRVNIGTFGTVAEAKAACDAHAAARLRREKDAAPPDIRILGAPSAAEIKLANESNALLDGAIVASVDFRVEGDPVRIA
jgi:hypothetical protein